MKRSIRASLDAKYQALTPHSVGRAWYECKDCLGLILGYTSFREHRRACASAKRATRVPGGRRLTDQEAAALLPDDHS